MQIEIRATTLPGHICGDYSEIHVGIQIGKDTVEIVPGDAASATWRVDARHDGVFKGKAIHGPKDQKFLYLVWIGRLHNGHATMFRRAKLRLDAVPADLCNSDLLVGEVGLTDPRGMPLCASVLPPVIRWSRG